MIKQTINKKYRKRLQKMKAVSLKIKTLIHIHLIVFYCLKIYKLLKIQAKILILYFFRKKLAKYKLQRKRVKVIKNN